MRTLINAIMTFSLTPTRACFLGVIASFGFAPYYAFALFVLGFGLFAQGMREDIIHPKQALVVSASFVFSYLLAGHYWVVFALGVDWAKYWPIAAPVSIGVPVLFGWLYVSFIMIWWWLFRKRTESHILFALSWWLAEQVKEHIFVGFPWNVPADVWTFQPNGILMLASFIGASGLGLLTMVYACWLGARPRDMSGLFARMLGLVLGCGVFFWTPVKMPTRTQKVVVVQPSIDQSVKMNASHMSEIMGRLKYHSHHPDPPEGATIIWAEGALPTAVRVERPYGRKHTTTHGLEAFLSSITRGKNTLFATAITYTDKGRNRKIFNSMIHVSPAGKIMHKVSKSRLLPLGEYVPFRGIMPTLLTDLAAGSIDMSPDLGASILRADGLMWHVLICFESQFADLGRRYPDADVLVVVTNDSWFGNSPGPYQHFSASVLRAIETGKPVVRVANNGISGIIDGNGYRHAQLAINEKTSLHGNIPQARAVTFYMQYPYLGEGVMVALLIIGAWMRRKHPANV